MGSDLREETADGPAVRGAEMIIASARLTELCECAALLRRTRARSEEIVDEARALLEEAIDDGDLERVVLLREQLELARAKYAQILDAYMRILQRITEERQEIIEGQLNHGRISGLSGVS